MYTLEDIKKPKTWTIYDICYAFLSAQEAFDSIKTYYQDACFTPSGTFTTKQFSKSDSGDLKMKITMSIIKTSTGISPHTILTDLAALFDNIYIYPAADQRKIVRDSRDTLALYFVQPMVKQDNYLTFNLLLREKMEDFTSALNAAPDKPAFIFDFGEGLSPGSLLRMKLSRNKKGFIVSDGYDIIREKPIINSTHIESVEVKTDPITIRPNIIFQLSPEGTSLFYEATSEYVNESIALLYNDVILFSARISEPIQNGKVRIAGQGIGFAEAAEIANYLNM